MAYSHFDVKGTIVSAKFDSTKTGNPFCALTIASGHSQGKSNTFKAYLFKEEYLQRFGDYLTPGVVVSVSGKTTHKPGPGGGTYFHNIEFLDLTFPMVLSKNSKDIIWDTVRETLDRIEVFANEEQTMQFLEAFKENFDILFQGKIYNINAKLSKELNEEQANCDAVQEEEESESESDTAIKNVISNVNKYYKKQEIDDIPYEA